VTAPSTIYAGAPAANPKLGLTSAYLDAESRVSTVVLTELGGTSPVPGVYDTADGTLGITGVLTLDAAGDPTAEWVFQASSTLITAANSTVVLAGGANPCNVFWQVGSSATLGSSSTMVGTIMADQSISTGNGTTVQGRLLARIAAVTLINTAITTPAACIAASSFSGPGGVPLPAAAPSLPVMGVDLPWLAWSLSLVAILAGATGVVVAATRRRAARS